VSKANIDPQLCELERLSTIRLLALDDLRPPAFEALSRYLRQRAPEVREGSDGSRFLIDAARNAATAIRTYVECVPAESKHLEIAEGFEHLLTSMT
jgi:hypothetical protein